jgi:polygalacturonase
LNKKLFEIYFQKAFIFFIYYDRIVKTKYPTDSVIVADVIATNYGADPTGQRDSTMAIQAAINKVGSLGGGTVFLPLGKNAGSIFAYFGYGENVVW